MEPQIPLRGGENTKCCGDDSGGGGSPMRAAAILGRRGTKISTR